jgi:hypothetical protein
MLTVQRKPRPTDPYQLRAIIDLQARGWTREEICLHFGFKRRTYYYRLEEIRRIQEEKGRGDMD